MLLKPASREGERVGRGQVKTVARAVGGDAVCERCAVADNPLTRLKGLLGRHGLKSDEGLLIRPTFAIHTWFMRFPIDVVFLDRELVIVDVVPDVHPWKMRARRGAKAVLELAAGESRRRGLTKGERLCLADARAA